MLQQVQVILLDFEPNDQSPFILYSSLFIFKLCIFRVFLQQMINQDKFESVINPPPQKKNPRNKTKQKHPLERISVKCFIRKQLLKYLYSYNQKDSKQGIDTRRRTDLSGL